MALTKLVRELRRRRVFRTAGLYVVGAWVVIEAADILFPGWGLPDNAINTLVIAAILGFPLALVFGWFFDVTAQGIVRTPAASEESPAAGLQRLDYAVLAAIGSIAVVILYGATQDILSVPRTVAAPQAALVNVDKPINSIAVLPFSNISDDPDNETFCDGVSEEILNKLGEFAELHVIARTSSFAFKNSDYDLRRVAALLGVRYLLQGSVRKYRNELRISAQLVDDNSVQQWALTFDRKLEDVFNLQSEIAELVAREVVPQVSAVSQVTFHPRIAAFELFQEGRNFVYLRNSGDAIPLLEKAIELEPGYAAAHAELAISLSMNGPSDARLERARTEIETALELQPGLPRALAAKALLLYVQRPPDFVGAEIAARAALDKSPNMVDAMNWLHNALMGQDRADEAKDWLRRAMAIDPFHGAIAGNLVMGYLRRGQDQPALQILERLLAAPEPSSLAFRVSLQLHRRRGDLVAMHRVARARVLKGKYGAYDMALNYALLGDWHKSDPWVERAAVEDPGPESAPWYAQISDYWRGEYPSAARAAAHALTEHDIDVSTTFPQMLWMLGKGQALVGNCGDARRTIGSSLDRVGDVWMGDGSDVDAMHAVTWACRGEPAAQPLQDQLVKLERRWREQRDDGNVTMSHQLYWMAQNALILGDTDASLDRLREAVDTGWRDYYLRHRDPRWDSVREDPRFVAMMAEVKSDVDRQRAEIDRIEASGEFEALPDSAP